MIQWVVIFVMLVIECVALLALIIPLPLAVKRGFMKLLTYLWTITIVKRVLITLFVFVAILFLDTLRSVSNADKLEMSNPLDRVTLFRNQRNLYLTGIVLFLLLVLYRFQALLIDLFAAEQKASAVASQAKNNGAGLDSIVTERDKLAKQVSTLEARVAELEGSEKAIKALKTQAENQKTEYLRVLEENKRLLDENTKKSKEAKKSD